MQDLFRNERDTIAGLGLLVSNFVRFDPPLKSGESTSHVRGFNVHCLIIDNLDGEVLAIDQNRIHSDLNPLQHAEQVAVRAALPRLHLKRPRPLDFPVEKYYKQLLFMAPGKDQADFTNKGCTLYNTFDPCGMCAVTLLVCYMKRICYLFEDQKYSAVYDDMRRYFKNRESVKEPLSLVGAGERSTPLRKASELIQELRQRVKALEESGVPLVKTLDTCREELQRATDLFIELQPEHLETRGLDRDRNIRTLSDIRRLCNIQ